ncbi:hypothetical protein J1N35_022649 [Gossypium stocksii]|uniref:Uncharacterized protein n=1 Tax=Gossypium stocksii TaxID=47602 RepID=A0A9D3VH23_9ROSI|nr:hypothetical protein J1N35_022649 [Gossypium stocksii]
MRKEKLGDRINALQKLVSPYGKFGGLPFDWKMLCRQIRHWCSMKRWVISGSWTTKFKSYAHLTCNNTYM